MLRKTSVQLDKDVEESLLKIYPELTISEIVRLCMEYTLECQPKLERGKDRLVG